jgi:putative oxidoreductase
MASTGTLPSAPDRLTGNRRAILSCAGDSIQAMICNALNAWGFGIREEATAACCAGGPLGGRDCAPRTSFNGEASTMQFDNAWLETAGRLLFVTYFVVAGLCNLAPARVADHIQRMGAAGTPFPALVHWSGIAIQFAGCALILTGWRADVGVIFLIVFTIAATAIFHRFWRMQEPARRNVSRVMFLNNVGVLAGLLLLLGNVR